MVQAPHAPPSIPEATNRKTVGTVVYAPVDCAEVELKFTVQGIIGPGKGQRPPVTVGAKVDEAPIEELYAARTCSEVRRIGSS